MNKPKFLNTFLETLTSSRTINITLFILFAIAFTTLLLSKYFIFQSIVDDDNTCRVDIVAPKTIEVVDTFKTVQRKKEMAQKIDPIMTPAEDSYIKNNLDNLLNTIKGIRGKNISRELKATQIDSLLDIPESHRKTFLIHFLLNTDSTTFEIVGNKSKKTLANVLAEGVTEKDFEKNIIVKIVGRNAEPHTTRNQLKVITGLIEQVIMPNMVVDEAATEMAKKNAMDSVSPTIVKFTKGEKIVFAGEPLTKLKRDAINKAGYNILQLNVKGVVGVFSLVILSIFSVVLYLQYFERRFLNRRYLSIIALLACAVTICAAILPDGWSVFLIPIPAFAIILSIFLNSRASFVITMTLLAILCVSMQMSAPAIVVFVFVALIAMLNTTKIKYSRRFDLIKIGIELSVVMLISIASVYLLELCITDVSTGMILKDLESGVGSGIISGVFVLGVLPLLENVFGIISPYGLAELADHNQPLLKRLQFEAPGTFSHSLMVSTLAEAAAEAVGGDPVLARVGALYHDIGKIKRPLFFVENQTYFGIENPHTKLNPRLSKMVITAHPKDGIDLAKEYGIPQVIQNFISQHHGESLASYFYNEALKQEGEENVKEEQFRYLGPKPNSKETAILMIADAVESASRTLKNHSQEELEKMINKLIQDRLNDGQLSDSPLTLKDLKTIAATFSRILRAAHHQRIKYHENIIQELEDKVNSSKQAPNISKMTDTELEDKIEKKIQKRQLKNPNDPT
ncbi:MAG: HDIG domain-containing protein [Candidatus Gastranaerophilales bacterium]|nr:HDIG domain-containing protein [Candidatus Gastranaerophilales bacterium]